MIRFIDVWAGNAPHKPSDFILRDVNVDFIPGQHTGIWCQQQNAWNCFFPLVCGMKNPRFGKVEREARVSWPIGWTGVFTPALTIRANLAFIARVNGCSKRKMTDFVADFTDLGNWMDRPLQRCPNIIKKRIAFTVPFAVPFDFYLGINNLTVGDAKFKQKCADLVNAARQRATFIIWSTRQLFLRQAKDRCLILKNGQFIETRGMRDLFSIQKLRRYASVGSGQ